jgi:PAS domain S-box-containing protein
LFRGFLRRKIPAMDSQGSGALAGYSRAWSPWTAIQSRTARIVLGFCAFELAYTCAYYFGMSFDPVVAAPFWFPDAVLLCGLLSTKRKWWWLLLAAILPVRLLMAVPPTLEPWFLGAVYFNDCAKGVIAALLLQRFLADPIRLNSMRDLGFYFLFAVVLVPALSALGGAAARSGMGHPFGQSFDQWLLGDALASLVVAPILFYWVLRPPNPASFSRSRIIEALLLAISLLVSMKFAFAPAADPRDIAETRYYAPVPFMVWAAIRFRMFGATAVAALLSIFAVDAALDGTGSFANVDSIEMSSRLQHFLLLRIAPLYLAAVLIEQWHHVNNSLRDSEQRFRNIANSVPTMMWTSGIDGGADFVNRSWLDFTGRTLEDSLGNGWAQSVHPEDLQRTFDTYMDAFHRRAPLEMEIRVRRHDGEYRWTLSLGVPRYGANREFMGYVGSALDLTERREQEAALRRSEARYRDVVESQSNFVCRLLADGTLTFVNSAYCRFLGRERLELLGKSFVESFPGAARLASRAALDKALGDAGQAAWECEVAHADGTRGWQSWVCHVLEVASDEARELQAIGYDVTDRKRAEESGRQLAQATRFAAVGELTAMVAHEINQPLCAILSNAEAAEIMLRAEQPPLDELREIIDDIRKDDLRADAAIRGIRSLLRRRDYEPRPVDLAATVQHVFRLIAGDALHRRVPIRHELATDLPRVTGDRSSIEQVLVILIVNGMDAMKDTPEAARNLVVSAQRDGEFVRVTVRDRGHGIAAANMSQLFDSFFTTKADGMGMGLSIARSMIFAHGGRIWAENAPDGGAAFHFTLAVVPAAA